MFACPDNSGFPGGLLRVPLPVVDSGLAGDLLYLSVVFRVSIHCSPRKMAKTPEITAPMFDVSDALAGVLEQPPRLVARDLIHGIAKSGHGFLSSAGKVTITHALPVQPGLRVC